MNLSNFYTSKEWVKFVGALRLERVEDDGYIHCVHCGKPIIHKYDCIGHHIIELTESNVNDVNIAFNPDNIALVHHRCHNEIHNRFGYERRTVYLVYGSPCAGKTTWVLDNAGSSDIILDIDRLWDAVCVDGISKPDRLKSNVFGLRDCLLDQIKTRRGKWRNAYVITTGALIMERKRLCDMLGAIPVYIDSDKDVCLVRAKDKGHGWEKYVNEWWEKFQPDCG